MNAPLQQAWWPVALPDEVRADRPLARRLHGVPLVLFRDAQGRVAALHDRCPHRHAPLSAGRVQTGHLHCPYHGWQFSGTGHCVAVPGLGAALHGRPLVPALAVQQAHGLVWACAGDSANSAQTAAPTVPAVAAGVDTFFMTDTVHCSLAEAAENFLDGFHTHFVHAGWLRHDTARQAVTATVRRLPDGIEAAYTGEGLQSGWVSRWLEGGRSESFGRFRWPGLAEIEYRGAAGLTLLVSAWLTPEDHDRVRVHARVATRQGRLPAWLKHAVLRRLFGFILRQDRDILALTHANAQAFAAEGLHQAPLHTRLDLLGPAIRALLAGEPVDGAMEGEHRVWL